MKKLRRKIVLTALIVINVGFFSCIDLKLGGICQLTPNELSHLHTNVDSWVYDGQHDYFFRDTITYLFNNSDTIFASVTTNIDGSPEPFFPERIILFGTSRYEFDEKVEIDWASVKVLKEFEGSDAKIYAEVSLKNADNSTIYMNIPVDTAKILGKIYSNVYKFEYPENSPKKFKSIFFAKKFGFIKIEAADGRTLQRLDM